MFESIYEIVVLLIGMTSAGLLGRFAHKRRLIVNSKDMDNFISMLQKAAADRKITASELQELAKQAEKLKKLG